MPLRCALLLLLGAGAAEAACPPAPARPEISFRSIAPRPEIIERLSKAEIQRMAKGKLGSGTPGHVNGLTLSRFEFEVAGSFLARPLSGGGYCVYPGRIEIEIGYPSTKVYVPREYLAAGRECARGTVRAHEFAHVGFNRDTLARHAPRIEAAAREAAEALAAGVTAASADAGGQRITQRIHTAVRRAVGTMQRELNKLHAGIDTAESYRTQTARCREW